MFPNIVSYHPTLISISQIGDMVMRVVPSQRSNTTPHLSEGSEKRSLNSQIRSEEQDRAGTIDLLS